MHFPKALRATKCPPVVGWNLKLIAKHKAYIIFIGHVWRSHKPFRIQQRDQFLLGIAYSIGHCCCRTIVNDLLKLLLPLIAFCCSTAASTLSSFSNRHFHRAILREHFRFESSRRNLRSVRSSQVATVLNARLLRTNVRNEPEPHCQNNR